MPKQPPGSSPKRIVRRITVYGPMESDAKQQRLYYPVLKNPAIAPDVQEAVRLVTPERTFRLKNPLAVRVEEADGMVTLQNDELDLLGYGRTLGEAWECFVAMFEADWTHLAMAPLARVHSSALPIRRAMRRIVGKVERS